MKNEVYKSGTYKWHEALLMAASGTPMHAGANADDYMKLDGSVLAWFDKDTNVKNGDLKVYIDDHWVNEWRPYTPKKKEVDWTKVPMDTDVLVKETGLESFLKRKFKCFVGNKVYVQSHQDKDTLISFNIVQLAQPNENYMK